jgi:hypothetical protein
MKRLLSVTGVIEGGTGILLLAVPGQLAMLLLGSSLETPSALSVARVAGVALLTLGVASWLARNDGRSRAARGLAVAIAIYNAGIMTVLVYGSVGLKLSGIGLWPTVLVHAGMAIWCVICLADKATQKIEYSK